MQVKQVAENARPNLLKLDGVLSVFAALKFKSGVPLDCFAVSIGVREKRTQACHSRQPSVRECSV